MREAAFMAGALVAIGLYLVLAASLRLTPGPIGIGVLAIAAVTAVAMVLTTEPR